MTDFPTPESLELDTPDIATDRLEALRDLIPEAFSEGKVDFDKLRAALGDVVDGRPERYSFTWAGKRDAIRLLQTPSAATLVPAPEESVNWDTTQHLFIEGDNLEVLKLLYKAYFGRIKLIYIDPPYNTGNDFVYPDDFTDPLGRYLEITGQKDAAGNLVTSNPETSGRFHSAWLSMMYPRLFLARQLLRDDGAIFVTIDDNEVQNLRMLLDEVFGPENFIASFAWQAKDTPGNDSKTVALMHNYVIAYSKSSTFRTTLLPRTEEQLANYKNPDNDPRGPWLGTPLTRGEFRPRDHYPLTNPVGQQVWPPPGNSWRHPPETLERLKAENRIWWGKDGTSTFPFYKKFLSEMKEGVVPTTWWDYKFAGSTRQARAELKRLFEGERAFDTPKPTRLIKRILELVPFDEQQDIVLDFFAGSGTTAHALLDQNHSDGRPRRYFLVQLQEPSGDSKYPTISDMAKERLRRVGAQLQHDTHQDGQKTLITPGEPSDLGFRVFKLAPSTLRAWRGTAAPTSDEYVNQLALLSEPLRDGWRVEDVVWEVAIKEGFPLTSRVTTAAAGGQEVFRVEDPDSGRAFHVCLDDTVTADVAAALGLASGDLLVVRDAAVDDTTAANLALQCRLKTL